MAIDYGTDLDWDTDMSPIGAMTSGVRLLSQAVFHRITTRRGMLIDAPDEGIDVRDFLSEGLTETQKAAIPALISQEILRDERIKECQTTLTPFDSGFGFDLAIVVTPIDDPTAVFTLTVSVSQAAALLTSATPGGA